jgi:hypothetical protein
MDVDAKLLRKGPAAWERRPVDRSSNNNNHQNNKDQRRLLNGGSIFVVSKQQRDGVEWCMDATEGTALNQDGLYPSMGLRPCAFQAGPTEQLFNPRPYDELRSRFPGDFCLLVPSDEDEVPKDGDRVRLGDCGAEEGGDFVFDAQAMINGRGQIQVAANTSLCVTYEGNNPDDNDRMLVSPCEDDDKFYFEFRTGWYELGGGGCVSVQDGVMEVGTRIVYDDCKNGFSGQWRIDGDGLFHSRKNDDFCMTAESWEEDTPVRLARCDPSEEWQQWEWPGGFEAPINLKSAPDMYLVVQGDQGNWGVGDVVIDSSGGEWSGDAVHV